MPHGPFSSGRYNLSYQRPSPNCRTLNSAEVENAIANLTSAIADPDLARLFENSLPNTLDTTVKWRGYAANNSDEELTFLITGDINAMWLRDSANQLQSYHSLLNASNSTNSLASLYRGVINLQSRYLLTSPFCNSFQPPPESGIPPTTNQVALNDVVTPAYNNQTVYECKFELDSLAAFLELSTNYYTATQDLAFFSKYQWIPTIQTILTTAQSMILPTYAPNGTVNPLTYTFTRQTTTSSDTLSNSGTGSPVNNNTNLIRSPFRPSDDSTIYQYLIPANMLFAHYLNTTSQIISLLPSQTALADQMSSLSAALTAAITTHGIIHTPTHGSVYAYEIDGYGGQNIMDDANIPSLLSSPFIGYLSAEDPVYQNTRKMLLSGDGNPYFMRGPVVSGIGGPHNGPGFAWPMSVVVGILTSGDEGEIVGGLRELVGSTDGLGLRG
ncbi:hypothetical protein ACLMJK_002401 [Lecanora helva]